MIPQIDTPAGVIPEEVTLPSKTYKLNITTLDNIVAPKYREVEYLESTGEQIIDPKITVDATKDLSIRFALTDLEHTTGVVIGNAVTIYAQPVQTTEYYLYEETGKCILRRNLQGKTITINTPDLNIHTLELKNLINVYFDGVSKGAMNPSRPPLRFNSLLLFNVGSIPPIATTKGAKARIYRVTLTDNTTGRILKDLVPVVDDSGAGAMFDLLEKQLYTNLSNTPLITGNFTGNYYYGTNNANVEGIVYADSISGYVDNLEAVKQAIYHILMTERYANIIYTDNYGVELEQYIGADFEYLEATIEGTLKDALTYDLRIKDVVVTDITRNTDYAVVRFTASTIYGDLQLEVNIVV